MSKPNASSLNAYLNQDEADRLKTIIEGTGAGTWEWNVQTGDTVFNERWAEIIGYTLEELQPISIETWLRFAHPADLAESERCLQAHFEGKNDAYECEIRMRHREGHWVWVRDYGRLVSRTPKGEPEWICGTHIDISTTKHYQQQLESIQAQQRSTIDRFERMASLIPGVIFQLERRPDDTLQFSYASDGIKNIYGVKPEEVVEDGSVIFETIHPDDRQYVQHAFESSRKTGEEWICEYRIIRNSEERWVLGQARPSYQQDGSVLWHGAIVDITPQKSLQTQLRKMATTDELTGTANRRLFMETLQHEFQRYKRGGPAYSVILFDFDWFKGINDAYGHGAGDQVLKETARRISNELRSVDVFGRIGGEEFAILLPDSDKHSARHLAERLRKSVADLKLDDIPSLEGSITCGIAVADPRDDQHNNIMIRADKAMYQGKAQGRNCVVLFRSTSQLPG